MEKQLKHLDQIIDKQISDAPVFTSKDKQNILAAIKDSTKQPLRQRRKTFVPRLLTAALFAGIIFTSYTMIDSYLTPDTATEIKKPEVKYAQELTQSSSKLTYEVATQKLTIEGAVKNATPYTSEPFKARVKILKEDVAASLESKSLALDDDSTNHILRSDESYSFNKVVTLDMGIVDENTLKDAFEVELYTEDKTLTSFVIRDIDYKADEIEVEEPPVSEQPDQETTPEEPKQEVTEPTPSVPEQTEKTDEELSLQELEKKYGKKKTPFNSLDIESKNGKFFVNGITIGMKSDEINKILGPYDKHSISYDDYSGHNIASWKIKNADHIYVNYKGEPNTNYTSYMLIVHINEDQFKKLTSTFGEPYYMNSNGITFYYLESSQQQLAINDGSLYDQKQFEGYQVILSFNDDPEMLKSVPPKE
ncbi:hypothetical protein [Bacillus sp. E(2018)]|uniref:hypothetical protein n=1 Tax=Bacillus sp. E(2018) TaxID=2502239 RepID=UPI0010F7AC9A|nr:hypothetical protein [Bacillus sp. E(2018)]